uniref:Protein KRBA1 n=1 Tax=Loxodonta africana TaxID=9785 RepID=G3SWV2_LOXAF
MQENYSALASLGAAELLPLSAFLSPTEPEGTMGGGSHADEEQESHGQGGSSGGVTRCSLPLSALVQLVKEIPEFLFREVPGTDSPEGGKASVDSVRASPAALGAREACPMLGARLGSASQGHSSFPAAEPPGGPGSTGKGRGREHPEPTPSRAAQLRIDKHSESGKGGEEDVRLHSVAQWGVATYLRSCCKQESISLGTSRLSAGSSPLQGLIDCLREILVPGPQHPKVPSSRLRPHPTLSSWRLTRLEPAPRRPAPEVKVEAAPGACALQGQLGHLKETPGASGTGQPPQQEEPMAWEQGSGATHPGGCRTMQGPPAKSHRQVTSRIEEGKYGVSFPPPQACRYSSFSLSVRLRAEGPLGQPTWIPLVPASRASSSPLEALEACLKGIPLSVSSPPEPSTAPWSWSPQQGPPGSPKPKLRPHELHSTEMTMGPLLPLGLQGPVRDHPACHPILCGSADSSSSPSSTDGDLDFRSPEGSQRHRPRRGSPLGSSLPQGLERHHRERPQPTCPWPSGAEPRTRTAPEEANSGSRGSSAPMALDRPHPLPPCHRGPREEGPSQAVTGEGHSLIARPPGQNSPLERAATVPSPLHCLENSLEGMLPAQPLCFTCLKEKTRGWSPNQDPCVSRVSSREGEKAGETTHHLRPPHPSPRVPRSKQDLLQPGKTRRKAGGTPRCQNGSGRCSMSMSKTRIHTSLPTAGPSAPLRAARRLEGRPGPCQPAGPTPGSGAWRLRGLEPGHSSPPVTGEVVAGCTLPEISGERNSPHCRQAPSSPPLVPASSEGGFLTTALPESPPLVPATCTQPPCPCTDLQQELRRLGAALSGKLDWLATTLASLSRDMAAVKDQVNQVRRHLQGRKLKGWASWLRPGAHRCPPYRRLTGPARPRPKLLRGLGDGGSAGSPMGKRPPPDTPPALAIPSGPTCGCAVRIVQPPKSPYPSPVPGSVSSPTSPPPEAIAEVGPPSAIAAPATILTWPMDTGEAQGTVPRGPWGGGRRDPRWGAL